VQTAEKNTVADQSACRYSRYDNKMHISVQILEIKLAICAVLRKKYNVGLVGYESKDGKYCSRDMGRKGTGIIVCTHTEF